MSAYPKSLASSAIATADEEKQKLLQHQQQQQQQLGDDTNSNSNATDLAKSVHNTLRKFMITDQFAAGSIAAFVNVSALYPLNKLIFRQMVGGHGFQYAAVQLKDEG